MLKQFCSVTSIPPKNNYEPRKIHSDLCSLQCYKNQDLHFLQQIGE